MSDKGTKMRQRRQAFRRLHGEKKAVSPVVATLILILIAVAAAAALYLWLVAWQGGVTKGIGSPGAQYTVTIGGSTSVYPFASEAANWFEQNNSDVVISVNQGGSGAGMAAVCSGQVDIGEASAFYSASTLETSDACPATLNEQIIAYDGVDAILPTGNPHGIQSMSWDTLQAIYEQASSTAPTSGIASGDGYLAGSYHMDGVLAPVVSPGAQGTTYAWDQIPACAAAQAGTGGGVNFCASYGNESTAVGEITTALGSTAALNYAVTAAPTATTVSATFTMPAGEQIAPGVLAATIALTPSGCPGATATAATSPTYSQSVVGTTAQTLTVSFTSSLSCTAPGTLTFVIGAITVNDFYYTGTGGTTIAIGNAAGTCPTGFADDLCSAGTGPQSPCGFLVCAGGTTAAPATKTIDTYYRSDVSGTQQSFLARLLAVGTSNTANTLAVGFTGCGGDNQWDGCGMALPAKFGEDGNPAVISAVAGDVNGIGFASDGLVQAATSGVSAIGFQGFGQSVYVSLSSESTALKAIAAGISDYDSSNTAYANAQAYVGWRPFLNVETTPPTGEVLRYLQFVMDPANNENIAAAAAEISVYASGLAGVVPVTPVTGYQVTI
ncbi:MAG TPA: substrate-binding domain-containing protein [Thermoplasmata archaeon]|nr:substrate-binding domain-containing protein [Thermoplasmata archaeon]